MSKNKDIWNTKENAEAYDKYALNFPMYKDTSKDLVTIADIQPGMIAVDLAAGTGATTQTIIDKTGGQVRVIVVDQAEEMLKKAKEKFTGSNIQFINSEAEDLDKVINDSVDAVICNSAFWQMKPKLVLQSVSNILKPNGIFIFNLPDSFFIYKDFKKKSFNPCPYILDDLILWGKEVGLTLIKETVKSYNKNIDEILAFNEIPVMKRNFKTEDEKNKFFTRLQEECSNGISNQRQWVYLLFRK